MSLVTPAQNEPNHALTFAVTMTRRLPFSRPLVMPEMVFSGNILQLNQTTIGN